jgi:flagellar biosynthetic protein FlhB
MAESSGDKTEAPTPRRRQEAREEGNIPRSHDLTSAVLLIGIMLLLKWSGGRIISALNVLVAQMLGAKSLSDFSAATVGRQIVGAIDEVAIAMAPLFIGAVILIIAVNLAQVGFYLDFARLTPNFAALNPIRGLGKLFTGTQTIVQLLMNLLKVSFVALAGYSAVADKISMILSVQQISFIQIFGFGCDIVFSIALRIGIVLLVLAIIDYVYQRQRIEQELKMSKQEVKDEMRRMDGDPRMKQRRRQIAIQRAVQKLKKNVPQADVVVTNPTHFAVALKYDQDAMHAPRVVAKGADFMAFRIRELAIEAGVPIVERPPLARAIYRMVDVGREIPEEFYSAVAEILAYVYELNGKAKRSVAV